MPQPPGRAIALATPLRIMEGMVVGLVVGVGVGWWSAQQARAGTLLSVLPSAKALALLAMVVLVAGWLLATVTPRLAAGLSLGATPGLAYACFLLDEVDHERAVSLVATVVVLAALGLGCAMQVHTHPTVTWANRRAGSPRIPRVPRR